MGVIGADSCRRCFHLESFAGSSGAESSGACLHAVMKTRCFLVGTPTFVANSVASATTHRLRSKRGRRVSRHTAVPSNLTGHSTTRSRARQEKKTSTISVACRVAVSPKRSGSCWRLALPMRISGLAVATASRHLGLAKGSEHGSGRHRGSSHWRARISRPRPVGFDGRVHLQGFTPRRQPSGAWV